MNINLKRRRLLGLLAKRQIEVDLGKTNNVVGISFEDVLTFTKCDDIKLAAITSELFDAEEIAYYNHDGLKGLFCELKGVTSHSNKKYKKAFTSAIKGNVKDFVQISIPVLSLLVAIMVITREDTKRTKEIQATEQKVEALQERIYTLETQTKGTPIDSLKIE